MKKIEGLYRSYCHERELEMQEYHTGGNRMKELQEFLKSKLNAEDYFTAEELLNDLITETEEKALPQVPNTPPGLGRNCSQNKKKGRCNPPFLLFLIRFCHQAILHSSNRIR